jgi:hypothetical protein
VDTALLCMPLVNVGMKIGCIALLLIDLSVYLYVG